MPNIAQWANTQKMYVNTKYNRLTVQAVILAALLLLLIVWQQNKIVDEYSLQGGRQQLKHLESPKGRGNIRPAQKFS